jgi:hypothetical protein
MRDKTAPAAEETARETAEDWLNAFALALPQRDPRTLADLFVPDRHCLLGLSWLFATFSGRDRLLCEVIERGKLAKALH